MFFFSSVFFVASLREAIVKASLSDAFDSKSTRSTFMFQHQKILINPGEGFVSRVSRLLRLD